MRRDDEAVTKDDTRGRTSEADEDKPGDYSQPNHANENLDGDNDMAIKASGIVMTVPDGRQGFDTEEERQRKRAGLQIRDAIRTEYVKRREKEINDDVTNDKEEREARPA